MNDGSKAATAIFSVSHPWGSTKGPMKNIHVRFQKARNSRLRNPCACAAHWRSVTKPMTPWHTRIWWLAAQNISTLLVEETPPTSSWSSFSQHRRLHIRSLTFQAGDVPKLQDTVSTFFLLGARCTQSQNICFYWYILIICKLWTVGVGWLQTSANFIETDFGQWVWTLNNFYIHPPTTICRVPRWGNRGGKVMGYVSITGPSFWWGGHVRYK